MRTSEVLSKLALESGERLSVAKIFDSLGDKAFALLIVILGVPNCIPMPPPIPLVCGFLLFAIAVQIGFGRRAPWAPRFVLDRSVDRKDLQRVAARAMPYVEKMERFSRPRLQWFSPAFASLMIALLLSTLSLGILTAAPVVGQIPWGLAVCLMGLGLVQRDGVLLIASIMAALVGASLSAGFVYALVVAIKELF